MERSNQDEFLDPIAYDLENSLDEEGVFFAELAARHDGPVLDIACGTGRLSIPLAAAGRRVVGIDISPELLARARERASELPGRADPDGRSGLDVEFLLADCRDFDLPERFGFALMTGHAFQLMLTEADQRALLGTVHRHLLPGGVLAFEVHPPPSATASTGPRLLHRYDDPRFGPVEVTGRWRHEPATRTVQWTLTRRRVRDGTETTSRIALRSSDDAELRALLRDSGFEVVSVFGDWDRSPVTSDSREWIFVCRRP